MVGHQYVLIRDSLNLTMYNIITSVCPFNDIIVRV